MQRLFISLLLVSGCGQVADGKKFDAGPIDAEIDAPDAPPDAFVTPTSCKRMKEVAPSSADGVYMIDPDGESGSIAPFSVYCDMTKDGGGWMLAMALAIDATGLTWNNLVPSFTPPQAPTGSTTNVLHHTVLMPAGVNQMMLMGGDRILKFHYPRQGVPFVNNYRDITERAAFRVEDVPADAPHTGGSRDPAGACGHVADACTTTDFALFKAADASCPRDATNSHQVTGCTNNCGTFGNCPGMGTTPPMPTPNCWFYGGTNATQVPMISTCPQTSQAPWGNYTPGTLIGTYTLWVR